MVPVCFSGGEERDLPSTSEQPEAWSQRHNETLRGRHTSDFKLVAVEDLVRLFARLKFWIQNHALKVRVGFLLHFNTGVYAQDWSNLQLGIRDLVLLKLVST